MTDVVDQLSRIQIIPVLLNQAVRTISVLDFRDKIPPALYETLDAALPHKFWAASLFQIFSGFFFCHVRGTSVATRQPRGVGVFVSGLLKHEDVALDGYAYFVARAHIQHLACI